MRTQGFQNPRRKLQDVFCIIQMVAIGKISYWTRAADEVMARIKIVAFMISNKEIMTQEKPVNQSLYFIKCDRLAGILMIAYSFCLQLAIFVTYARQKKLLLIITERGGWIARRGFIHLLGQRRRMIVILYLKSDVLTK